MSTGQKKSPSFSQTYWVRASDEFGIGLNVPKLDESQIYTRLEDATLPPLSDPKESIEIKPQNYLSSQSNLVLPSISHIEESSYKQRREDNLTYYENYHQSAGYNSSTFNPFAPLWKTTEPHNLSPSKTSPVISQMTRSLYSPTTKYYNPGLERQPRGSPKYEPSCSVFQNRAVSPLQEPCYSNYEFNWTPAMQYSNPTGPSTTLKTQPKNNVITFDFDNCVYPKLDSTENKVNSPEPNIWTTDTNMYHKPDTKIISWSPKPDLCRKPEPEREPERELILEPVPVHTQTSTVLPKPQPVSLQFPYYGHTLNTTLHNFDWQGLESNVKINRAIRSEQARVASYVPPKKGGYYRERKKTIPPPPPSRELSPTSSSYNITEINVEPSKQYHSSGLANEGFYVTANNDPEGHFQAKEGDYITERFCIISSLGQGAFGSVFKCMDRKKKKVVAVKVFRNSLRYREAALNEYRILHRIKTLDNDNFYHCVRVKECIEREAGNICLVFDLLGSSLFDFHSSNHFQSFPQEHIQHFALQILQSLNYFHYHEIVHTDLKPENIMLVSADCISSPPKKKRSNIKESKILTSTNIQVIDFGSAIFESDHHSSVVSTRHYRAPEIIMGLGWSYPCDIWSVGCMLAELVTGEILFRAHNNVEHLAMMEAVLGPIPRSMAFESNDKGQSFFGPDGKLSFSTNRTTCQSSNSMNMRKLNKIIGQSGIFEMQLTDLLKKMMAYSPEDRITANDALDHPFFKLQLKKNDRVMVPQEHSKSPIPGIKRERSS